MRNILLLILSVSILIGLLCSACFADVYILVDKASKEVVDMSPQNDAVVQPEQEKIILPGKLTGYELQYHPNYYFYKNNKFVLNIKKISDEENAKEEGKEGLAEEQIIRERIRKIAIDKLKEEGIVLKYNK